LNSKGLLEAEPFDFDELQEMFKLAKIQVLRELF